MLVFPAMIDQNQNPTNNFDPHEASRIKRKARIKKALRFPIFVEIHVVKEIAINVQMELAVPNKPSKVPPFPQSPPKT